MADRSSLPGCGPVPYTPKQSAAPERQEAETKLMEIPGVQGVGEGRDDIGDPAWIAYVLDGEVASRLPKRVANRPVVPLTSGKITIRPAE